MAQTISNRIYVAGLDGKVSAADLRAYFGKFGALTDVYIPNNHQTGQPKHFGFVTFAGEESAQVCLNNPSHEINGQPVDLKPCVPKDQIQGKGGFGKADAPVGMLGTAPLGLGMGLPMQPTLMQPALGGLNLQAFQQQMLLQQQMQQQQLLQQFLAKMQQPQQVSQPDLMLLASLGGCGGVPATTADAATGSALTAPGTSAVPSTMCMPTMGQSMVLPFSASTELQLGVPTPTANLALPEQTPPPLLQGLSAQQPVANQIAIDQIPASMLQTSVPLTSVAPVQLVQQIQPLLASEPQGDDAKAQLQTSGVQVPLPAGSMPPSEAGVNLTSPSFGSVPAVEMGQGTARSAPY